jgi:hypothetical protein
MNFPHLDAPSLFSPVYGKLRKYDEDLSKMIQSLTSALTRMFEGGVDLLENTDSVTISYTTNATPNTEDGVAHNLKRIPIGFIVYSLDKGAVIYKGTTTSTVTTIYLKCTVASTAVKILIF